MSSCLKNIFYDNKPKSNVSRWQQQMFRNVYHNSALLALCTYQKSYHVPMYSNPLANMIFEARKKIMLDKNHVMALIVYVDYRNSQLKQSMFCRLFSSCHLQSIIPKNSQFSGIIDCRLKGLDCRWQKRLSIFACYFQNSWF